MSILPFKKSTSPNPHFDKSMPVGYILCVSCKEPLWEMEVRTAQGKVVSSAHQPIGRNKEFMTKSRICPLCSKNFDKDGKFLFRSKVTGQEFLS
jgi:hypothetical protein